MTYNFNLTVLNKQENWRIRDIHETKDLYPKEGREEGKIIRKKLKKQKKETGKKEKRNKKNEF